MDPHDILTQVALSYIGTTDKPTIDQFRKAVTGIAQGQSWCLDFVWFCIAKVCAQQRETEVALGRTELVSNLWDHSPLRQRYLKPQRGYLAIWMKKESIHGHCGIVTEVYPDYFHSVEGNTGGPQPPNLNGVWRKMRALHPVHEPGRGDFILSGFVDPFV